MTFDAGREFIPIIRSVYASGDPFKLLGLLVDTKLIMRQAVEQILARVRPRIKALLRTRSHYSNASLVGQFKTHVWGLMEAHPGGIFHASTSILDQLDHAQKHFLDELGVSVATTFLDCNFSWLRAITANPSFHGNLELLRRCL